MRSGPRRAADRGEYVGGLEALRRRARRHRLPACGLERDEVVDRVDVGVGSLAGEHADEPQDRPPLGLPSPRAPGRAAPSEVGDVADRQLVEGEVVVSARERRGNGQDHVGARGRLVDVAVDRDHELERLDRRAEPPRVGRREQRVAGDGDQRPDLPLALGLDLLGEAGDRQLAERLRRPRTREVQRPIVTPRPRPLSPVALVCTGGGVREHRTAARGRGCR